MSKKWQKLSSLEELREKMGSPDNSLEQEKKKISKKRTGSGEGMVYSTDPNYSSGEEFSEEIIVPSEQELRVQLDKKNRKGKSVTLITGFEGSEVDLKDLGKRLKSKCGVGGSAKNGEIIIQGDHRDMVAAILEKEGFRVKRIN